jgi:hypothetical protein
MGIPDGAHTHSSGGRGLGTALLVLSGAALAVKLAAPVAAAVGELVHVVLVLVAVVAGVAGVCLLGFCTWRLYRWRQSGAARCTSTTTGMASPPRTSPPSSPERTRRDRDKPVRAAARPLKLLSRSWGTPFRCTPGERLQCDCVALEEGEGLAGGFARWRSRKL